MTAQQILDKTPDNRINAGKYVKILAMKKGKSPNGNPTVRAKTKSTRSSDGKTKVDGTTYLSEVEVTPKEKVIISCSCEDFKYRFEAALEKKGAARILYSDGSPPTTTNPPPSILGCCKHLVKVMTYLQGKRLL